MSMWEATFLKFNYVDNYRKVQLITDTKVMLCKGNKFGQSAITRIYGTEDFFSF